MYNINRRQYILKTSSGQYLNIFYKSYTGICCSKQTDAGAWTPPVIILKDALPGFCAYLDKADNIHMLCQDAKSNIRYITNRTGSWYVQHIFKNNSVDVYDKYPCLFAFGANIYFFYIIEDSGKKVLVYQIYSQPDSLSSQKVIDLIRKTATPFSVSGGTNGSIHLFYVRQGEKNISSGYRVFDPCSNIWTNFTEISNIAEPVEEQILSAAVTSGSNFHICIQRALPRKYELVYINAQKGQIYNRSETVLSTSPYPFTNSSMVVTAQKLLIYWVRDKSIFYCMSCDKGNTWSKPEKYHLFDGCTYYCAKLFSNFTDDNKEICGTDIPVCISDGFHPAFIGEERKNSEDKGENSNMDKLKASILNMVESIKASINEINHSVKAGEEKLKKVESKLQELELAFKSCSVEVKNNSMELEKCKIESDMLKTIVSDIQNTKISSINEENIAEFKDTPVSNSSTPKDTGGNLPIMVGSGFAQITCDYLKKGP